MIIPSLSSAWSPPAHRPLILGHRGASDAAPENTLEAFVLSLEQGAEGVELDIRLNASGELIVTHDNSLQRVTAGNDCRLISDLTTAQCAEVRLADGLSLPTLESVLQWAQASGACVNIEMKSDNGSGVALVSALVSLLQQHQQTWPQVLVSSFSPSLVWRHQRRLPLVATAWLIETMLVSHFPWHPKAAAIHPNQIHLSQALINDWHWRNFRVHAWTVDNLGRARQLALWGVDALITNQPDQLLRALEATDK